MYDRYNRERGRNSRDRQNNSPDIYFYSIILISIISLVGIVVGVFAYYKLELSDYFNLEHIINSINDIILKDEQPNDITENKPNNP